LADVKPLMRLLPWETWLEEAPHELSSLAADVACRTGLRELLPALRRAAHEHPAPALLRAFGELQDPESTPLLLHLLASRPDLRPVVCDSLGRIGGDEVREALRKAAPGSGASEARLLYKALSLCAVADDAPLFRAVIAHHDWYVRLAAAEVLGRFPAPENQPALSVLAADPVPAVAHRALSSLDG
jgi:HEAT repeat protein